MFKHDSLYMCMTSPDATFAANRFYLGMWSTILHEDISARNIKQSSKFETLNVHTTALAELKLSSTGTAIA